MWTTVDGMLAGAYQLPPEEGAAVKARLEDETQRIFRQRRTSGEREMQDAYAADAFVTAIVKKGKHITTVAHLGRHLPAELRTALVVGGRECVIEGCSGRAYLEVDHSEVDHAQGGPTALWNLDWECWTHHRLETRGWRLGPPDPRTGKRRLDPPAPGRAA